MTDEMESMLTELLGDDARVVDGSLEKEVYSTDIGDVPFARMLFETLPLAIVQPKNTEAVIKLLTFANDENLAVFPRGSGSSGLGGVIPTKQGIVIDLSLMQKVSTPEKSGDTPVIEVEAGARWSDTADIIKPEGLSIRAYPSSFFSTVGGWIATGGYGIGSFKYGHLAEQIASIEVVLPGGALKRLTSSDPKFSYYFGTEGQFGVIVKATLKLKKETQNIPRLIHFESPDKAFEFIREVVKEDIEAYHIKYLDRRELHEMNLVLKEALYNETDSVLLALDSQDASDRFSDKFGAKVNEAKPHLAKLIWHERLFPMKKKVLGPTLLASELIFQLDKACEYIKASKDLSKRFKTEISVESHITGKNEALVLSNILCDSRSFFPYMSKMSLVPILTRLGIKQGGKPYGIGIWNVPFVNARFDNETIKRYEAYKTEVDPNQILNPAKFFKVRSKMANIPALGFNPTLFAPMIDLAKLSAPVLGAIGGKDKAMPSSALEKASLVCSRCGSCAAVCPAYIVTEDERLTPRSKLILARKLLADERVPRNEVHNAFLCMHCGMCEEVCQNGLELVSAWEELEELLEKRSGVPDELINEFVSRVEGSDRYWRLVDA